MASTVPLPRVYICRHGETAWTVTRQHTGRTDIPLTDEGKQQVGWLRQRLGKLQFPHVWSSPSSRARVTAELIRPTDAIKIDEDLAEWDYGDYEGLTGAQIRAKQPGWIVFRDGCPNGESVAQISARADRVVARLRSTGTDVLIFSSGHFSRVLAARWLGLDASAGQYFALGTASLSVLSYEHTVAEPSVLLWNERATD